MQAITSFTGPYRFLSNFFIEPDGTHVEGEYQSSKVVPPALFVRALSPYAAKAWGNSIHGRERPDWRKVNVAIMHEFVWQKFTDHSILAGKLLATDDAELIEGNDWGDTFWGVSGGRGQNHHGRILMTVRNTLRALRDQKGVFT